MGESKHLTLLAAFTAPPAPHRSAHHPASITHGEPLEAEPYAPKQETIVRAPTTTTIVTSTTVEQPHHSREVNLGHVLKLHNYIGP